MGMYTQVRGWLNVNSIGTRGTNEEVLEKFNKTKQDYLSEQRTTRQKWVTEDTTLFYGGNGSIFIFIGTELKNYDNDAEQWLEFLIGKFDNSEGHIMFQYEEDVERNKVWVVAQGKVNEKFEDFDFKGYGNMYGKFYGYVNP